MQTLRALFASALLALTACAAASDAAESDAEQDLLAEPLAQEEGGDVALLSDGFEHGSIGAPTWRKSGDARVRIDAARNGAFGVQLGRRAALVAEVDTRGRRDLTLSFDVRTVDLKRGESLLVELSLGGRFYLPIAYVRGDDWQTRSVRLPSLVDDRDDVRVRFVVLAGGDDGHDADFAGVLIDDVAITSARPTLPTRGYSEACSAEHECLRR